MAISESPIQLYEQWAHTYSEEPPAAFCVWVENRTGYFVMDLWTDQDLELLLDALSPDTNSAIMLMEGMESGP